MLRTSTSIRRNQGLPRSSPQSVRRRFLVISPRLPLRSKNAIPSHRAANGVDSIAGVIIQLYSTCTCPPCREGNQHYQNKTGTSMYLNIPAPLTLLLPRSDIVRAIASPCRHSNQPMHRSGNLSGCLLLISMSVGISVSEAAASG